MTGPNERRVGDRQVRIIRTPVGTRIEEIPEVELEPEDTGTALRRGEGTRKFQTHRQPTGLTGAYPQVQLRRRRPHWVPLAAAVLLLIMSSTFWAWLVPAPALDWRKLGSLALMVLAGGYVCWHMDRLAQWTKGVRD